MDTLKTYFSLKVNAILIFSIAFGIASDGNMYFLTKYKQELKNNQFSISKTVSLTIRETGGSRPSGALPAQRNGPHLAMEAQSEGCLGNAIRRQ